VVDVRFGRVKLIEYKGRKDSFVMSLRNLIRLLTHQKPKIKISKERYDISNEFNL